MVVLQRKCAKVGFDMQVTYSDVLVQVIAMQCTSVFHNEQSICVKKRSVQKIRAIETRETSASDPIDQI